MPDDLRRSWKPGTLLLFWLTPPKKINCYCFWKLSSSAQNSNISNYVFFFLAEVGGWDDDAHYDFIIAVLSGQFQGKKSMLHSYG